MPANMVSEAPTLLTSPAPMANGKPLMTTENGGPNVVLNEKPVQQTCPFPFCWASSGKFVALDKPDLALGSLYPALSSATWFSGAFPEDVLRQRVEELLAANPWLGSSVQKDPATGETALWVSGKPVVGKFFEIVHRKDEQVPSKDAEDPAPFLVNGGRPGLLQPDDPAFKVTAVCGPTTFCVVISLWAGLGDLHTYYSVFSMLFKGGAVPMQAERPSNTADAKHALMGGLGGVEEGRAKIQFLSSQQYRDSAQFQADFMRNECKRAFLVVNQAWLKEQEEFYANAAWMMEKGAQAAQFFGNGGSKESKESKGTPPSRNEILASFLMRELKMDLAIMPVNARGSVPGLDDRHAGNHLVSRYLLKEEFEDPVSIRRVLDGYQEAWGTKTPSRTACLSLRRGTVINATEWLGPLQNGGAGSFGSAQQVLHVPILSLTNIFLYGAIFAPRKGELAVMLHADEEIVRGLESHPAFAGPVIKNGGSMK